jgi:hypothetical protein
MGRNNCRTLISWGSFTAPAGGWNKPLPGWMKLDGTNLNVMTIPQIFMRSVKNGLSSLLNSFSSRNLPCFQGVPNYDTSQHIGSGHERNPTPRERQYNGNFNVPA